MGGDSCGVHGGNFSAEAQHGIRPQRDERAEPHRGAGGQPDFGEARFGNGHATFETDGHEQVNGQSHIKRFGEFQIALGERGDEAERKKQNGGGEKISLDGLEEIEIYLGFDGCPALSMS